MEKTKWLLSVIVGAITAFAHQYSTILIFVWAVVVLDFITGLIKAKAIGEPISSKKGTKGFYKKLTLFVALFFGFFLDYFIPFALGEINITLPIESSIFGMIIGCYIVINESISICENLYIANPGVLPKWVVKMLTNAHDQIDRLEDKSDK